MVACASSRRPDAPTWLEPSPQARAEAIRLLPDGPTYVGIAPGSRQPNKNWPIERFRAAALELALEALYLAKRVDKVSGEGETVYG